MALFAKSAAQRYAEKEDCTPPQLGTHVDDIFGGFTFNEAYHKALHFRTYLCETGKTLTLLFNTKVTKTPLPAREQVILGCLYDSRSKHMRTATNKKIKYLNRINLLLAKDSTEVSEILTMHGNLNYAALVTPFGRPFLAPLTNATIGRSQDETVPVSEHLKMGLRIWKKILTVNRGISFDFILGNLPKGDNDIFVDASTEWGIGGCCGRYYFMFPWASLRRFRTDVIAKKELLACLISLFCFKPELTDKLVTLYTDNQVVSRWLHKSRSGNRLGTQFLACYELQKYKLRCKISPAWIPGHQNNTADAISRNSIPEWLCHSGIKRSCDLKEVAYLTNNAEPSWGTIL